MKFKAKNTIEIEGTSYQKTLQWGNRKLRIIFKNRKKYDRNKAKKELIEA